MSNPLTLDDQEGRTFRPDREPLLIPDHCKTPQRGVYEAVEHGIQVIERILDSGQVALAEYSLKSMGPDLDHDADQAQAVRLRLLRVAVPDWQKREEAAGGPGSLIDPQHPFIKGCTEAAARSQDPMPL